MMFYTPLVFTLHFRNLAISMCIAKNVALVHICRQCFKILGPRHHIKSPKGTYPEAFPGGSRATKYYEPLIRPCRLKFLCRLRAEKRQQDGLKPVALSSHAGSSVLSARLLLRLALTASWASPPWSQAQGLPCLCSRPIVCGC